jgi:glycerol-3-phosphate acyltransferase PlsY
MPGDAIAAVVALLVGYLVGSVPVSAFVGRAAGVDVAGVDIAGVDVAGGQGAVLGPEDVWRLAGPGAGLLALVGDLAKGVIPVALGLVTWSWGTGWVAGLGALLGAGWPLFGRLPGERGVVTLAGVVVVLAPAAAVVAVLPALLALGIARLLGRNGLVAAVVAGFGSFAVLSVAGQADVAALAGLAVLYLVVGLRHLTSRC